MGKEDQEFAHLLSGEGSNVFHLFHRTPGSLGKPIYYFKKCFKPAERVS